MNYFIEHYGPESIVTFSDLRWNTGELYEKIGFEFSGYTGLNYWYVDVDRRKHRFSLKKSKRDHSDISENELRKEQGWLRIWDCGNNRYVWRVPE